MLCEHNARLATTDFANETSLLMGGAAVFLSAVCCFASVTLTVPVILAKMKLTISPRKHLIVTAKRLDCRESEEFGYKAFSLASYT